MRGFLLLVLSAAFSSWFMIHVHYNSSRIPALVVAASPFDFGGWEKDRRLFFFLAGAAHPQTYSSRRRITGPRTLAQLTTALLPSKFEEDETTLVWWEWG